MPASASTTTVLVNPTAGRRWSRDWRKLERVAERTGVEIDLVHVEPADLEAAVTAVAARGDPRIGVAGGDGSHRTAAAALVGTGTALVPIPTGTLNRFAARTGIMNLEDAAKALVGGETVLLPVGLVDQQVFLNTATIGLYADVVRRRERMRPILTKWPAAGVAFLSVLARSPPVEIELQLRDISIRRVTHLLWVGIGTGSFPNPASPPHHAPQLEFVVVRSRTRYGSVALLGRVARYLRTGVNPPDDPGLEIFHGSSAVVRSDQRIGLTLDGEVFRMQPPFRVTLRRGALRVVVISGR